jgi:chemotaxis protein MotB
MSRYTRRTEEESENTHHWLLTYSDVVTLCLTFFVLLYSFSTLDAYKWKSLISSLRGALGVLDGGNIPLDDSVFGNANLVEEKEIVTQEENFKKYQKEMRKLQKIQQDLMNFISSHDLESRISTSIEERGLVIRFQDSVLFSKGSADLYPESRTILLGLAEILKEINSPIRIEGHTDDLPINTPRYPSNWELSTARAVNVLRYLIEQGISEKLLSAVGYGEFHPLVPNTDEENRSKNRRVDLVIIRESLLVNEPQ